MKSFVFLKKAVLFALIPFFILSAVSACDPKKTVNICGSTLSAPPQGINVKLENFAQNVGLEHPGVFAKVSYFIFQKGKLPKCYKTKKQAKALGWRPGADLWESCNGCSIGGNRFFNREGILPPNNYVESDLDYTGGKRGARRLVFVRDAPGKGQQWVTMDHYKSFKKVPYK
jgi:hypothetical protein